MKNVDCNIIKDLLPSYVDKISSEETNKLIEKHLLSCQECSLTLNAMNKYVADKLDKEVSDQTEQIDYLKKYRKNKIMTVIFAVLVTICIILFTSLTYQLISSCVKLPVNLDELDLSKVGYYSLDNPNIGLQ